MRLLTTIQSILLISEVFSIRTTIIFGSVEDEYFVNMGDLQTFYKIDEDYKGSLVQFDFVEIIMNSLLDLQVFMEKFHNKLKLYADIIFNVLGEVQDLDEVLRLCRIFWSLDVYNYYIYLKHDNATLRIFYNPFKDKLYFNGLVDHIFDDQLLRNIRVTVIDDFPQYYINYRGERKSVALFTLLQFRREARLNPIVYAPKTVEEAVRSLQNHESEASTNTWFYGLFEGVTYSTPTTRDDIVILVPTSLEISQFQKVLVIFNTEIWILLACMSTVIIALLYLIEKKMFILTIFTTFIAMANVNFKKYQKLTSLILIIWIHGVLIISWSFTSSLLQVIITKRYFPQINTFEELKESNLKIKILKEIVHKVPEELRCITVVSDDYIQDILSGKVDSAYAVNAVLVQYIFDLIHRKFGDHIFHVMDKPMIPAFQAYMFRKKSPYIKKFESIINAFIENGIQLYQFVFINIYKNKMKATINNYHNLNLNHVDAAIIVLIIGICLSVLGFFLELVVNKFKSFNLLRK